MNTQKFIFLDIDGTLLDYTQNLPPSSLEAIRLAQTRGHKLLIATGRSRPAIYPWLRELGFDGIISGDGAFAEFGGKIVLENPIPEAQISRLREYLEDQKIGLCEECNSGLYGNRYLLSSTSQTFGITLEEAQKDLLSIYPGLTLDHQHYHLDVNKVSFVPPAEPRNSALEEIFGDFFRITTWTLLDRAYQFGDFTQKNQSKASAVSALIKSLGIDREDTIALGDAGNDMELLQYCHIGIAMGNATDSLKAIADYITSDVTDHGVYNAFKHYGLI